MEKASSDKATTGKSLPPDSHSLEARSAIYRLQNDVLLIVFRFVMYNFYDDIADRHQKRVQPTWLHAGNLPPSRLAPLPLITPIAAGLTKVCRAWRQVCFETSSLWVNVRFTLQDAHTLAEPLRFQLSMIEQAKFVVWAIGYPSRTDDTDAPLEVVEETARLFKERSTQIQELILSDTSAAFVEHLFPLDLPECKKLYIFSITGDFQGAKPQISGVFPRLKHLDLPPVHSEVEIGDASFPVIKTITHNLGMCTLAHLFACAPDLKSVTCKEGKTLEGPATAQSESIQAKSLNFMDLRCLDGVAAMSLFNAPILTTITLPFNDPDPFPDRPCPHFPLLESAMFIPDYDQRSVTRDVKLLPWFFRANPTVKELRILIDDEVDQDFLEIFKKGEVEDKDKDAIASEPHLICPNLNLITLELERLSGRDKTVRTILKDICSERDFKTWDEEAITRGPNATPYQVLKVGP